MPYKYVPLTQQKYCCVPTCIQIVMYKNGIPLVDQEDIGNALGLTIPIEDAYLFENPRVGEKPRAGWGILIDSDEFRPNTALKKLSIPLVMTMNLINEFESTEDIGNYLLKHQNLNSDILICYSYGNLFDTDSNSGHVNVFESYNRVCGVVTPVDPGQRVPKYRQVTIEKLFRSLVAHGSEKSGGFGSYLKMTNSVLPSRISPYKFPLYIEHLSLVC